MHQCSNILMNNSDFIYCGSTIFFIMNLLCAIMVISVGCAVVLCLSWVRGLWAIEMWIVLGLQHTYTLSYISHAMLYTMMVEWKTWREPWATDESTIIIICVQYCFYRVTQQQHNIIKKKHHQMLILPRSHKVIRPSSTCADLRAFCLTHRLCVCVLCCERAHAHGERESEIIIIINNAIYA